MQKLDRLGWAAGMAFTAFGVRVGVRVNQAEALERIRAQLPLGWRPSRSPIVSHLYSVILGRSTPGLSLRRYSLVYADATRAIRTHDPDEMFRLLETQLHFSVAEHARGKVFVHAGVVGWKGRAIVVPGRSYSGKSSLVATLVRAGATYYSDEFAVLDRRGRVHPYPLPLGLREGNGARVSRKQVIEEPGGRTVRRPLPVGLVVSTTYRAKARWQPRRLSAGRGVFELLANTLPARRQPGRVLDVLCRVVSQAPVLRGVRGEAEETARLLLSHPIFGGHESVRDRDGVFPRSSRRRWPATPLTQRRLG